MAHEITATDQMFTVRKASWHGLETVQFGEYPTRADAQKIAHPWEPTTEPVYRAVPEITAQGDLTTRYELIEGYQAVVRDDTGFALGVTNDTYEPVRNSTMWDIAEALEQEGKGDVQYETGGSLRGGKDVWLLLKLREPLIIPGDERGATIPYFGIQNSHDGSGSFRGQATEVRIVCKNTSHMADLSADARGTSFTFRHTKGIHDRIEEARDALAGWRHSVEEYQALMTHLTALTVTAEDKKRFLDKFIPMPKPGVSSVRVERNIVEARDSYMGFLHGVTCESVENKAAGLIHAAVEYAEHGRKAHSAESRFRRAYLGKNEIVAQAAKVLRQVVTV